MMTTVRTAECDARGCTASDICEEQMALPDGWSSLQVHVQGDRNLAKHLCPKCTSKILELFLVPWLRIAEQESRKGKR
jgi:hypothetical protein